MTPQTIVHRSFTSSVAEVGGGGVGQKPRTTLLSGTGSAVNGQWRPQCYIPMERMLGNRKRERRRTKGMVEMGQVSRETCLICFFRYTGVSKGKGERENSGLSTMGCEEKVLFAAVRSRRELGEG